MNTQVTRPGHMIPGWQIADSIRDEVGGWAMLAEDTPAEAKAEARAAKWLERIQWLALGLCLGMGALWVAITF